MTFLPDFGKHLTKHAAMDFRLIGTLTLNVLARYGDRLSVTGSCTQAGAGYCASFDFDDAAGKQFASGLKRTLYLSPDQIFAKSGDAACAIDPPLPVYVDFQGVPGPLTHSTVTAEEFAPLLVNQIGGIRLAPSHDVLERRQAWWSKLASNVLDEFGINSATRQKLAIAVDSGAEPLGLEAFFKYLAVLRLVQPSSDGKSLDAFMEFASEQGWLAAKSMQQLRCAVEQLRAQLAPDSTKRLRKMYVNLIVWYSATRILAGVEPGSLEADLRNNWGSDTSTDLVISEGRCCLARLGTQPLMMDSLDEAIGQLARGHEGIRKIIEMRIAKFPRGIWDHPEISTIIEPYVRYDLFRHIYSQRPGLVTNEMAMRCEENVRRIASWLALFATIETELFVRGMEALSVQ